MLEKSIFTISVFFLAGCALSPGIHLQDGQFESSDKVEQEEMPVTLISITPSLVKEQYLAELETFTRHAQDSKQYYEYLVGPQDVLSITVWDHPELTIPDGGRRPVEQSGNRVRSDGSIFYPYVGLLQVAGKTTEQIRVELTKKLSHYIKTPQLDVRVVTFNSQKVHVAGAVANPGVVPLTDVPLTLGDIINLSGGVKESADLQEVILTRDGSNKVLNLQNLYFKGDLSQNILLKNKDIIFVPINSTRKVYVMGEVNSQATLSMRDGKLNLAEVMATAGIRQNSADPERIFVLRKSEDKALAYHLDASEPGALILATTFALKPLDVVFVSTSNLSLWNRVLSQLLPTAMTLWTIDRISNGEQ